jgi:hypothetical protein
MRFILAFIFILAASIVMAQPGPPPPDPGAPVPLSGIEWLLAGGAAYGVARIRKAFSGVKNR